MTYQIRINRSICSGYGECVGIAPEVFMLGNDKVSIVLDAACACPVDAITLIDQYHDQVWPA